MEDYNFDGIMDFSILQYDGGMMIYDVYRVFTYSKEEKRFIEHHTEETDLFFNLIVDKKEAASLHMLGIHFPNAKTLRNKAFKQDSHYQAVEKPRKFHANSIICLSNSTR